MVSLRNVVPLDDVSGESRTCMKRYDDSNRSSYVIPCGQDRQRLSNHDKLFIFLHYLSHLSPREGFREFRDFGLTFNEALRRNGTAVLSVDTAGTHLGLEFSRSPGVVDG